MKCWRMIGYYHQEYVHKISMEQYTELKVINTSWKLEVVVLPLVRSEVQEQSGLDVERRDILEDSRRSI